MIVRVNAKTEGASVKGKMKTVLSSVTRKSLIYVKIDEFLLITLIELNITVSYSSSTLFILILFDLDLGNDDS